MRSPLLPLSIALLITISTLAAYGAWYAALSRKSNEVANLEEKITTTSLAMRRVTSARATIVEVTDNEALVRAYFVPETAVVAFINDLEARGFAQKAPITVLSVSTGGTPSRPTLLLALSLRGTFDAVMRTVGSIEYAPYAVSITSLSVRQDAKNSWSADMKLDVGSLPITTATSTP